ncbi:mitochondrial ribosomal protein subunit L20-domain-containing protein [Lentinula aciculospora]|uniref:Mitochondrial ribosomal protein subunit L20-domain-containing protein n=1 Tax=Lentinula aciculospora TaxID=153920 RepID=A0A9W9AHV7_9AGAR|nr:mitochondrial ribosomal protein subunit L20-domain-containing protein [Lentinula aciculospora]
MLGRRLFSFARPLTRNYASKWPRPKPGTSERPPYRAPDPLINNSSVTVTPLLDEDLTFIHRPPPTAPSPISYTTNPVSPLLRPPLPSNSTALPPLLRPSASKSAPPRVTAEQITEIRRLRSLDPVKWTRGQLAKKFHCTQRFVALVAATKKTTRAKLIQRRDAEHEANRVKWSEKRSLVVAISQKRRQYW